MYNVYESKPEYLQADPQGADIIAIPCKPGSGTVKRGTVMYRDSATGLWSPASAAEAVAANMLAVLDETVDTDANPAIADDARAYRGGHLVRGRVVLSGDAEITAEAEVVLRAQGIVLDPLASAETFTNTVSG